MEINRLLNPTTLPLNTRTPSSRMSLSNLLSPSEPNSPATSTGPLKKRAIKQSTRQPKKRARNLEEEEEKAVKSRRRWTPAENKQLSALKGEHLSWAQIAAKIPDRSHTSCRLRFQNYVDSKDDAEKERKAKVARLYMRYVRFFDINFILFILFFFVFFFIMFYRKRFSFVVFFTLLQHPQGL